MKSNQDIRITEKCRNFFESVPEDYKSKYDSEFIRPIAFLNLWSMFILYSYFQNVEFEKNFEFFNASINYFLKEKKMSRNSNQFYILLMVWKIMHKTLVIEKEISENENFHKYESIKQDKKKLTNLTIAKKINADEKSFDLKEDEETKHNYYE